jgi:allophanate hydrolase subunit 2
MVGIGGYQGRQLALGDLITIARHDTIDDFKSTSLPENLRPQYSEHYDISAMVGPHDEGYLLPEDIEMIYETNW